MKETPKKDHSVPASQGWGQILGMVIDPTTGEPLAGAIVRLGEKGVVAGYDGKFEFGPLPTGTYTLTFEMVSYQPLTLTDVTVKPGKTTEVRAAMFEDIPTLETVVVEGEMRKSSDVALVALQKNSVQISDGFSGDMVLKQTPNFQFNTVLRRMPGVALVEDRYLSIRGLFERYNNFTLNGALVPINDFERNGFDYSYLPSNLISSLRIVKTASPDVINEFGGGYVQMETADIPAENALQAFVQGEYHPLTTFRPFLTTPTNRRPFLLRETRGLPADFPTPAQLGKEPGLSTPENLAAARRLADGKLLTTLTDRTTAPPGANMGITWQKRFKIAEKTAGITAYAGHFQHYRLTPFHQQTTSIERQAGMRPALVDSFGADYHRREANLTGMLNFGMRLGTSGKFTFKNTFIHHTENARLLESGNAGGYLYGYTVGRVRGSTLYSGQALWEKKLFSLPGGDALLSLNPFYSVLDNRDPVFLGYNFFLDSLRRPLNFEAYKSEYQALWTARQTHHLGGGKVQIEIPFAPCGAKASAGLFFFHNVHDHFSRFIGYSYPVDSTGELMPPDEERIRYRDGKNYFADLVATGDLVVFDFTVPFQNYRSVRTLWAPFVQASYRPVKNLLLHGGVRIETYRQHIRALPPDSSAFDIVRGTLSDLFPSFNAAYSLNPKTNVRWAYSKTVVRPRDRELVPFAYLDYVTTFKTRGNANLIRTKIHNFDLRYEFYPRKADLLSATLFYKYFFHPVEQALNEGQLVNVSDPVSIYDVRNQSRGAVAGLEVEFRQSLESYVNNRYLAGLGVYGNLSLMTSRINPRGALGVFGPGRGLQGQANFLLNLGLTYREEKTGLEAAVFYNRAGRRIALVGISDDVSPSIFEMPRDVIDVQVSKTFFERLTVRFAVQDLLGQRFKLIQFYDGGKTFDPKRDNRVRNERRAPFFYLTVNYKIK